MSEHPAFWMGVALFVAGSAMQAAASGLGSPLFWGPLVVAVPLIVWVYRVIGRTDDRSSR